MPRTARVAYGPVAHSPWPSPPSSPWGAAVPTCGPTSPTRHLESSPMPPCNRILPSRRGHLLTADAPFIANADTSRAIDAGEAAKLIDALRAKNGVGPDVSAIIMQADGTVVADHAADVAREPASTMKTLTSLAAASVLDMGDTLPTQTFLLQAEQGTDTVVIKGNGDMLLGAGDSDPDHVNGRAGLLTLAKNTAHALKQRGVSRQWNGANPRNPDVFESYPALSQNTAADVTAIFRNLLGAQGITIVNAEPTQTTVSADRTPIAEVESAPLAMVMAFMLRHSDNTLAEEFGRLLALSTKQENSPAGATAAVRNELRTLGIDLTGLQMADCSGLTPGSRLTANTLAQVQARNLDVGGAVAAAEGLSIPGLVGTAANRLASTQAAGLTRVKTGSLQEVSSMTGNVSREQGGVAAFAVIVNNPEDFEATRTAINEFVAGLAAL
ncbi:MAG: D-alanyl-D-alanine carboxypeptidase/D-alanyl-D-alanine-endopeptidase [Bifidobacterium animalis]|nr:D-alanyl-D-alanine carboxypeptidase/D-alanyl-D-alanine-endopeptidase [Bifidobacterium animalis]